MSHVVRNVSNGLIAIEGGRVLAPGDDAEIEPNDHDAAIEAEGRLMRLTQEPQTKQSKES